MTQIPSLFSCPGLRSVSIALLLSLVAAEAAAQTTWYVDASGTPPGSGTQVDPYTAIQAAVAQAADGDTILVLPGTYVETVDYLLKDIVVRSTGGPLATEIRAVPGSPRVVTLGRFSTLEGFTVSRTGASANQIGVKNTASGELGRIVRCIVRGHDIGVSNDFDCSYEQCTITQNRIGLLDTGLAIQFVENSIVCGNTQWDLFATAFGGFFLRYSDVSTISFGACSPANCPGTFDLDPRFWNAAALDFHLRPDSPCIDAGDPADPLDPDGSRIDVGALTYDPLHAPGTAVTCFGSDALCPCGNGGSGAAGCDLAQGTGGIAIAIQDFTPDGSGGGTADIVGTGYPVNGFPGVTLIRSPGLEEAPVVFGDGLRCISAAGLVRISAVLASGGLSLNPVMHGAGAGTYHYQLWARNTPVMFCDPAAGFNLSSALTVTW